MTKHIHWLSMLAACSLPAAAFAVDAPSSADRLEEIEIVAKAIVGGGESPTQVKLNAFQPSSIIGLAYIANSIAPTADFATIANIAPGVSNVETNGPGLSESKHLTIRGFDDNKYNVTFDGIPFGDQNDWSHHTTSYFPAKLIGQVFVDRGPGKASTIGQATFGGTLGMLSKDPRSTASFIPTYSYGSWGTRLEHYEVNSGVSEDIKGGSLIASYQKMSTDGYRSNADMNRDTYYLKYLQPIGDHTTITVLSTYNKIRFTNPGTVTQSQIDTLGRDYGLGTSATATDYTGYNFQFKTADFEYIGIDSQLTDNFSISNKVYTYSYNNRSREKPKTKVVTLVTNFLGSYKVNEYRTSGDTFIATYKTPYGDAHAGFWYDQTHNPRYLYGLNYTQTGNYARDISTLTVQFPVVAANPNTAVGAPYYNFSYNMLDTARTTQVFADYDWKPVDGLLINAGIKHFVFTRVIDAQVNGTKARKTLAYSHTDTKDMGFLSVNWMATKDWSVYAQAAQGFLSPNLNQFYVDTPDQNTIKPGETFNLQAGTVYHQGPWNLGADVFSVDFKNYAYSGPVNSSGDPAYIGIAKGAKYQGMEIEGSYEVGGGLSLYANASSIKAKFKESDLDVPTVPKTTMAAGLSYNRGAFFGSFDEKYVGSWAVYDTLTNPDVAGGGSSRRADSDSYWIGDLAVGYSAELNTPYLRSFKVRMQVTNVFNQKVQVLEGINASAANAYTGDTFNVLPERGYFLTVSGEIY